MFCRKCGTELKDTDKFCFNCGTSVEEVKKEVKEDSNKHEIKEDTVRKETTNFNYDDNGLLDLDVPDTEDNNVEWQEVSFDDGELLEDTTKDLSIKNEDDSEKLQSVESTIKNPIKPKSKEYSEKDYEEVTEDLFDDEDVVVENVFDDEDESVLTTDEPDIDVKEESKVEKEESKVEPEKVSDSKSDDLEQLMEEPLVEIKEEDEVKVVPIGEYKSKENSESESTQKSSDDIFKEDFTEPIVMDDVSFSNNSKKLEKTEIKKGVLSKILKSKSDIKSSSESNDLKTDENDIIDSENKTETSIEQKIKNKFSDNKSEDDKLADFKESIHEKNNEYVDDLDEFDFDSGANSITSKITTALIIILIIVIAVVIATFLFHGTI